MVRAVGAEVLQEHIIEQAEDENWIKLEWLAPTIVLWCRSVTATFAIHRWRLHLRPRYLSSSHIRDDDIPALPQGLSAVQVLGDFMKYLFKCARNYIVESHASGASMWRSLEGQIEFVLTHPNGWEGSQQQHIRRAAELAGLVPAGEGGQSQLHLLTEGEAMLYFCIATVLASDTFSKTPILCSDDYQGVAIIDAGDGTIDMSLYSVTFAPSMSVEEIAPAECKCLKFSSQDAGLLCASTRSPSRIYICETPCTTFPSEWVYIMNALLPALH